MENPYDKDNGIALIYCGDNSTSQVFVRHGVDFRWICVEDVATMIGAVYLYVYDNDENVYSTIEASKDIYKMFLEAGVPEFDRSEFFHSKNPEEPMDEHDEIIKDIMTRLNNTTKNALPNEAIISIREYLNSNFHLDDYRLRIKIYDELTADDFGYYTEHQEVFNHESVDYLNTSEVIYGKIKLATLDYDKPAGKTPAEFNKNDTIAVFTTHKFTNHESSCGFESIWDEYTYTLNIYLGTKYGVTNA